MNKVTDDQLYDMLAVLSTKLSNDDRKPKYVREWLKNFAFKQEEKASQIKEEMTNDK